MCLAVVGPVKREIVNRGQGVRDQIVFQGVLVVFWEVGRGVDWTKKILSEILIEMLRGKGRAGERERGTEGDIGRIINLLDYKFSIYYYILCDISHLSICDNEY